MRVILTCLSRPDSRHIINFESFRGDIREELQNQHVTTGELSDSLFKIICFDEIKYGLTSEMLMSFVRYDKAYIDNIIKDIIMVRLSIVIIEDFNQEEFKLFKYIIHEQGKDAYEALDRIIDSRLSPPINCNLL